MFWGHGASPGKARWEAAVLATELHPPFQHLRGTSARISRRTSEP